MTSGFKTMCGHKRRIPCYTGTIKFYRLPSSSSLFEIAHQFYLSRCLAVVPMPRSILRQQHFFGGKDPCITVIIPHEVAWIQLICKNNAQRVVRYDIIILTLDVHTYKFLYFFHRTDSDTCTQHKYLSSIIDLRHLAVPPHMNSVPFQKNYSP